MKKPIILEARLLESEGFDRNLTQADILGSLNGFELEFDVCDKDGNEIGQAKVLLKVKV